MSSSPTLVTTTRAITDNVILVILSCGHRLAVEGPIQSWPLGRQYACPACLDPEHPEPYVTAISGSPENIQSYTLFLSCGHFCQAQYHHGLRFATVSQLLNTQQFCLQCADTRKIHV